MKNKSETFLGITYGFSAFLIWGLCPIFWKQISQVPATEAITHRIVWSFLFLLPLILFQGKWKEFVSALTNIKTLGILTVTTLLVAGNWFTFIWAINHNMILQTSLGYYINPLVNVFLGMIFLKERLRKPQALAVLIAGIGVMYLAWRYGEFPVVALVLAFSFGFYGLIRKMISIDSAIGLAIETLILTFPGIFYLLWLEKNGAGTFMHTGITTDILLMATALVTALPLLLFNMGARRLNFSTIGFLQYVAPSTTFLLAVFLYKEPLSIHQITAFIFIWAALLIYSVDSIRHYRKNR